MLTISKQQMEALAKRKLPPFFSMAASYTENEFPDYVKALEQPILEWVESTYYEAREYGMESQRDHCKFINYKCIFGDDFLDKYDFARSIMQSTDNSRIKLSKLNVAFKDHFNRKY